MKGLPLFFLIIILPLSGFSRTEVDSETAIVDLSIFYSTDSRHDFETLIIPIKRVRNLIVVEAQLDSMVGNFILDTGSPNLVLNKTYFRQGWRRTIKLQPMPVVPRLRPSCARG